jgi:hypothetical protein
MDGKKKQIRGIKKVFPKYSKKKEAKPSKRAMDRMNYAKSISKIHFSFRAIKNLNFIRHFHDVKSSPHQMSVIDINYFYIHLINCGNFRGHIMQ